MYFCIVSTSNNHIQDGCQMPSLKNIFNSLNAVVIIKYVFKGVFWYAGTILKVVSNDRIQDVHQTSSLEKCYL